MDSVRTNLRRVAIDVEAPAPSLGARLKRQLVTARLALQAWGLRRHIEVAPRPDMLELGSSEYGYWTVPETLLGEDSVCYLAGTGTDITFDLGLIERYGCTVHAFDPVPAAREFVTHAARDEPRFVFEPVGLWSTDTTLTFHAPAVAGYVSHSATDLHGTEVAFVATVRSVKSLMRQHGHDHIDLLKVSAEGSEYEILESLERDGILPQTICVEFAQPAPRGAAKAACDRLARAGYEVAAARIGVWTCRMTFVLATAAAFLA